MASHAITVAVDGPDGYVRLRVDASARGRAAHRADRRHRAAPVRSFDARVEQAGVPPRRRPRPGCAARGLCGRGCGCPPGVHDHRHGIASDDPRDQRRGHAERVFGSGRGRGERFVYASSVAALRLSSRQPDRHDRGVAGSSRRPPVLRPGEGRTRAAARRAGGRASGPRAVPAPAAGRARPPCGGCEGHPAGAGGGGSADHAGRGPPTGGARSRPAPDLPMQFIHEDDVGQALLKCVLAKARRALTTSPRRAC